MKWEPAALMAIVLALGLWIAFGPASRPNIPTRQDALTQELRIGSRRGLVEASPKPDGTYEVRLLLSGSPPTALVMSPEQTAQFLATRAGQETIAPRSNLVFRTMNITSWVGVVWLGIGLLGQLAFSGRMVLQWITSERRRESVITESFWWFSLLGSLMLFSYFVWRQDPVAILGQASGIVIYARNLRLIYKRKRRAAAAAARGEAPADPSPTPAPTPAATPAVSVRTLRPPVHNGTTVS